MTTNAMPVSEGKALKKARSASNPPAEAPMPTIVNPLSLLEGSTGAFTSFSFDFFVGRGDCFDLSGLLWLLFLEAI